MGQPTADQMRALLLRRLAPEEVARLETAIFEEEGVAESLLDEEFDLLDDYVRGRLTPADRADVERYLSVTPERIESLRVARALAVQRSVSPADVASSADVAPLAQAVPHKARESRKPGRRRVFVAILLASAAGLAVVALIPLKWWSTNTGRFATAPPAARTVSPATGPLAPSSETGALPTTAAPGQIVMLLADADRGGGSAPTVHIAAGTATLRLQTEVPDPPRASTYSIRVDDASGGLVFEGAHLAARAAGRYRFVEVAVPVQVLGTGSRTISLRVDGSASAVAPEFQWKINFERADATQKK
jgi:hypothetical protein